MKIKYLLSLTIVYCGVNLALADDITTLDGHKYETCPGCGRQTQWTLFFCGAGLWGNTVKRA